MCLAIFGLKGEKVEQFAIDLGMAFQLTNILRDVREDAERGRIYIPLDELERFGVTPDDIFNFRGSDKVQALLRFQLDRAKEYYQKAYEQLPEVDRYSQRSGLVMAAIYEALLHEIEKDGLQVMQRRIRLTPLRKLWIAWRTHRREKRRYHRLLLAH